jgi:hypothetical protein
MELLLAWEFCALFVGAVEGLAPVMEVWVSICENGLVGTGTLMKPDWLGGGDWLFKVCWLFGGC